jgi:transposase
VLEPNAAGIDVGAREMFVAVPPGADEHPVRVFTTFTEDLHRLADWLAQSGVTTVAMEATGVYWIPLYEILEQRGIRPCLVNARHMKNVPGRRTDWHECQWLQFLHSVGYCERRFGLRKTFAQYGPCCGTAASWSWQPRNTCSTCTRR